jgi:diacylglycerol kinase
LGKRAALITKVNSKSIVLIKHISKIMNVLKNGLKKRIKSFGFALTGIYELVRSEPNARIHLLATIVALGAGFFLKISNPEWCVVLIVIALVWAAEAFNTVIEKLADHLFPEYHETARIVKDVSAGAVLICAIVALVCGLIIFLPKIMLLL